jgi:hypothetical protein
VVNVCVPVVVNVCVPVVVRVCGFYSRSRAVHTDHEGVRGGGLASAEAEGHRVVLEGRVAAAERRGGWGQHVAGTAYCIAFFIGPH